MSKNYIYDNINDPLSNYNVYYSLFEYYKNYSITGKNIYFQINNLGKKTDNTSINKQDKDYFESLIFNKWKNSILSITDEEYEKNAKNGKYNNKMLILREYLKNVPDVKTTEQIEFFEKNDNKEIEDAVFKYGKDHIDDGWIHYKSKYLTARRQKGIDVSHRFYLNVNKEDLYKMSAILVNKFDKYNIPFYFKISPYGNRDDSIVIYSSSELLPKTLNILNEIAAENKDLVSRFNEPPLLTGRVTNWLGYGSEPTKMPNQKDTSYNEKRANIIPAAFFKPIKDWVNNHLNEIIRYHGNEMTVFDYVCEKIYEKIIDKMIQALDLFKDNKNYNLYDLAGYDYNDLKNPQFTYNLKKRIRNDVNDYFYKGKDPDKIKIIFENKKERKYEVDIRGVMGGMIENIIKKEPTFTNTLISSLRFEGSKIGIDPNNFCFDIDRKRELDRVLSSIEEQNINTKKK